MFWGSTSQRTVPSFMAILRVGLLSVSPSNNVYGALGVVSNGNDIPGGVACFVQKYLNFCDGVWEVDAGRRGHVGSGMSHPSGSGGLGGDGNLHPIQPHQTAAA